MSNVKIYTATPADLSPPVQSESFCVDLVLASDYRELEAKCAALAAECESKKSALAAILEHCPVNDPDIDKAVAAMIAYENLYCEKAPAIDAFLAEMRAQGVEMAIGHIEQTICPNHETILNEFAARLRKGAA
ncbi:TPA: hypothetical protein O5C63_004860, partial [Salmonella enterica subsp. enterica serovar Mokola]|nr:hypothetical protein [Salmonella enterica subsp. enterica serovar Mokola]HDA4107082.1 hypothetical protein [Salmonella enterica subsp. enterica serovar Mokola]HDA4157206.1 hypothetical protein [Salmonella enterica subsp. enterica serovar Mokola]HDA4179684.1 hypothetical protein [Salmonella enterica subsp. enterica serovar Mokola]HDA4562283.1 hypothetical protein [Salmonella enterica subsp. enterica serovar Mokola]